MVEAKQEGGVFYLPPSKIGLMENIMDFFGARAVFERKCNGSIL